MIKTGTANEFQQFRNDTDFAWPIINDYMVLIFITYLIVLLLMLFAMVKERFPRVDINRFMASGDFWEVYFIFISVSVLCYLVITSKELSMADTLTLN